MRLDKIYSEGNKTLVVFSKDGEEVFPLEIIRQIEGLKNSIVVLCGSEPFEQEPLFHIQVICETLNNSGYTVHICSKYSREQLNIEVHNFMWRPRSYYLELMKILDNVSNIYQEP